MRRFPRLSALVALDPVERGLFIASWMLAAPVSVALSIAGFRRTTGALEHVSRLARPARERSAMDVVRAEILVRRAFRWSPARWHVRSGGCLPQSIVQYALQTLAGDPVRLVVGVPPKPGAASVEDFEAHAWVEERGQRRADVKHTIIFELPRP